MLQNIKQAEKVAIENKTKSKDSVKLEKIDANANVTPTKSDTSDVEVSQLKQQVFNLQQRITDMSKQRDALKDTSTNQNIQLQRIQQMHIDEKTALNKKVQALNSKVEELERSLETKEKVRVCRCHYPSLA